MPRHGWKKLELEPRLKITLRFKMQPAGGAGGPIALPVLTGGAALMGIAGAPPASDSIGGRAIAGRDLSLRPPSWAAFLLFVHD